MGILMQGSTVLWDPINDMPIPTESESMNGLKGKFRRGGRGAVRAVSVLR